MLRTLGVPARIATGYAASGGNAAPDGWTIVRDSDAHAWVEVWLGNDGWTRVDPTAAVAPARVQSGAVAAVPQGESLPMLLRGNLRWLHRAGLAWDSLANSWNQVVLGYAFDRQRQLMQRIGIDDATWQSMAAVMFVATGVIMLALALLMLHKLRALRPDPVAAAYARFCRHLARRGIVRHPSEGPVAFNTRAIAALPELAGAINMISNLYIRLRYGNAARPAEITAFRQAVKSFTAPAWR